MTRYARPPARSWRRLGTAALTWLTITGVVLAGFPGAGAPEAAGASRVTGPARILAAGPGVSAFSDVEHHWARREIEALLALGALDPEPAPGGSAPAGPTGLVFRPDEPITRGDFVTYLVRALGYADEANLLGEHPSPFTDVSPGQAVAGYVNAGTERDLVRGYPDQTFGAGRPITRAEISALLVRVIGLEPGQPSPAGLPFTDRQAVPDWAAGYIASAYSRGMVRGYPDQSFRPQSGATRAEAVCLIYRALAMNGQLFDVSGLITAVDATAGWIECVQWPAGRSLTALDQDGTLTVLRAETAPPPAPGPPLVITLSEAATVYRNQAGVGRDALAVLDEVRLVLGPDGLAAHVEAFRFDGLAQVAALAGPPSGAGGASGLDVLTLRPLGSADGLWARQFSVLPWAPLYLSEGSTPTTAATAPPGGLEVGDVVYFVLDSVTGSIRALALIRAEAGAARIGLAEIEDPSLIPGSTLTPGQAMAINAQAAGVAEVRAATGADGRGLRIAIIDTGIDVSHPDLAMTSGLRRKVVDWQDFSGEGDVTTTRISAPVKGHILTDLGQAKVSSLVSRSGYFHSGVFKESQLDPEGPLAQDADRNGQIGDRFLVVAVDTRTSGTYDTVYVDTDRDLDLTDEVALRPYGDTGLIGWFGPPDRPRTARLPFVLAAVRSDGNRVTLGFDGNGHGTHVAGIAGAYGSYRGGIDGMAPGAELLALKALGSSGDGTWTQIIAAVSYAAQHGADIIVLSVANLTEGIDLTVESEELRRIVEGREVLVVLAAGNSGPGLGTTRGPNGGSHYLTIGASLTPELWQALYGYDIGAETIWPFSAVGPRADGSAGVDLTAPGSAMSAAPFWLEAPGYAQSEGTSMAAPHVAGLAAVLWQAAGDAGMEISAGSVRDALLAGARSLDGYSFVEQGYGSVDGTAAWAWLTSPGRTPPVRVSTSAGIYSRAEDPARVAVTVAAPAGAPAWVDLAGSHDWLEPDQPRLALPEAAERTVSLSLSGTEPPGLYSGRISGYAPGGAEVFGVPVTTVRPHQFSAGSGWTLALEGDLGPARLERHFFRVPMGAAHLEVVAGVALDERDAEYAGRVRVYLYGPDGRLAGSTDYVGAGTDDTDGLAALYVAEPAPGVWEAVIYSSAALSAFGLERSEYWLEAAVSGLLFDLPGSELGFTVPTAGALRLQADLPWTNAGPAIDGEISGYGLWTVDWPVQPETISLRPGQTLSRTLPVLGGGAGLLRVLLNPIQAPDGQEPGDLDLYLYRREATGWREVAKAATPGVSAEVVEVLNPPAGEYVVYVEGVGIDQRPIVAQLRSQWLASPGDVLAHPGTMVFGAGASGILRLTVDLPPAADRPHQGALRVSDRFGRSSSPGRPTTVSLTSLTVRPGAGAPRLLVAPGWIVPGRNLITFEVRDQLGFLVPEFQLILGGRSYQGQAGRASLPMDVPAAPATGDHGPGSVLALEATVVLPDGTHASWVLQLPLRDDNAPAEPELPVWLEADGFRPANLAEMWEHVERVYALPQGG